MISFRIFWSIFFLILLATWANARTFESSRVSAEPQEDHILSVVPQSPFSVDPRLKKNVDFWVKIYSEFDSKQGVIHDAKYIDHVYENVTLESAAQASSRRFMRKLINRWRDVLLAVHRKQRFPERMNDEEKRVYEMFADVKEPNKFLNATHRKRLRFQLGQKDRFREGLYYSGRYLTIMEDIFKREGLPIELTRLPFVESSFNIKARSKVGASGVWQFMRSTGKLFLKINDSVDERNDPIRATEAAAKLLRLNYESLKSWPLAVTAYNHGRKGMMRAVRKVGSDELEDLVSSYKSRTFGFASSNFFTELLAAVEVEKNSETIFGKIERAKPLRYVEIKLPDWVSFTDLTSFLKLDVKTLRDLNPGLTEQAYSGHRLLPSGYLLRLPQDDSLEKDAVERVFLAGYDQIPSEYKYRRPNAIRTRSKRGR